MSACPGTRLLVIQHRLSARSSGYGALYGEGLCAVCGKLVVCHKDRSAVYHMNRPLSAAAVEEPCKKPS